MAIEAINNSSQYKADNIGDIKPKIKIGGSDILKFVPNINMSFHNDEFFINLNRKDKIVTNQTALFSNGKVSQSIDTEIDEYYIKDGFLKWDIVFDSIPAKMDIVWDMNYSEGLSFHYQDTLENDLLNKKIDQKIFDASRRPDNIIGSYAIWCNKENNKYKTGKVCHITRPFVIDLNNKKEWAVIDIKNKKMTITLPESFMKTAAYPVRLDPNFGYETKGGSALNAGNNCFFTKFTSTGAGDVSSLSAYIKTVAATAFKFALYSAPVSDTITLRTGSAEATESSYDDWRAISVTPYTITDSTVYSLGLVGSDDDCTFYYDSGDANQEGYDPSGDYATAWKASCTCTFPSALKFSIYATYSSGGSTYNDSVSESASISDELTNTAIFGVAISESSTISDSDNATGIFNSLIAELISVSDNISSTAIFLSAISEAVSISDIQNAMIEFASAISESLNITDQQSVVGIIPAAISESIGISDSFSALTEFICSISEDASISDLFQSFTGDTLFISESVNITDSYTNIAALVAGVSESVIVQENLSAIATLLANISEAVSIADLVNAGNIYLESISESASISDLVSVMTAISKYISATMTIKNKLSGTMEIKGIVSGGFTKTGKIKGVLQ